MVYGIKVPQNSQRPRYGAEEMERQAALLQLQSPSLLQQDGQGNEAMIQSMPLVRLDIESPSFFRCLFYQSSQENARIDDRRMDFVHSAIE